MDEINPNDKLILHATNLGQKCLKSKPVIVLGSGSSIPCGLPSMQDLAKHLILTVKTDKFTKVDRKKWEEFTLKMKKDKLDFEYALKIVELNKFLRKLVISKIWSKVYNLDNRFFLNSLTKNTELPLSKLFNYLFSSTASYIDVVTTNYDRIAEYSAEKIELTHYTGFSNGYKRNFCSSSRFLTEYPSSRVVKIWKVHGSIDWFVDEYGQTIALTPPMSKIPANFRPAIVTPGIKKYEEAHYDPFRTIISKADSAFEKASAFFCIGFGFNDNHISTKLIQKWKSGSLLVILTKTLSESTKKILRESPNNEFLALEETKGGTKVWSNEYPNGEILKGNNLWNLSKFLNQTI